MCTKYIRGISAWHSVESPSMVDPQWNIWYSEGPSEICTQSAEVLLAVSGA